MSPFPQNDVQILYPGCQFQADYVLEWNAADGGEFYASICMGCGVVHFYDQGALKYMTFAGKDRLSVLLSELLTQEEGESHD